MRSVGWVVGLGAMLACGSQQSGSGSAGSGPGAADGGSSAPASKALAIHVSGSGTVQSAAPAMSCRADCRLDVAAGENVLLMATPDSGFAFSGWQGDCSGNSPCSLAMSADRHVSAVFSVLSTPPAQCAGLQPAPSTPVSVAVGGVAEPGCGPSMGDGTGAVGLQATDFTHPGSHATFMHFMDGSSGTQRNWTGRNGSNGSSAAWVPQPEGFIAIYDSGPATGSVLNLESWSSEGKSLRNSAPIWGDAVTGEVPSGGLLVAGVFGWTGDVAKKRQLWMFAPDLSLRWTAGFASPGTIFGLGCDLDSRCLIITDGGSAGRITGQWFESNGTAMTGELVLLEGFQAGSNTWFETAPLIGGGVFVRRVDQQNDPSGRPYRSAQWLVSAGVAPGVADAPRWLKDRPDTNLAIVYGTRAYAVLPMGAPDAACAQQIEVLAPDGTRCGAVDATIAAGRCRTEDVAMGLDGTPIQPLPRVASQLTCPYRWWKGALR